MNILEKFGVILMFVSVMSAPFLVATNENLHGAFYFCAFILIAGFIAFVYGDKIK